MAAVSEPSIPLTKDPTPPPAGAGMAVGPVAARHAVAQAVAALHGTPSLVLLFPDGALDAAEALEQAHALVPGVNVAGMTASGEIGPGGPIELGCSAMAFGSTVAAGVGVAENASRGPRAAGAEAATAALRGVDVHAGHPLLMLFLDTSSGDQSDVIAGAYEVAGPEVPLVGGAAGGANPAQLALGTAARDRVVAVAVVSFDEIGVGIAHGCSPCAVPSIVTRAEGRVVVHLDGRPAEQVYLEKLGRGDSAAIADEEFERLATVHPIAQPELHGDVRLRHVLGRAEDGGLECATHIPSGAAIEFRRQTPEAIVRSTFDAVSDALRPINGPARAALIFDCAGRRSALGGPGEALAAEVRALVSSFGGEAPQIAGLYTRGEVGRVRGAKGDRNHAVVVAAFG